MIFSTFLFSSEVLVNFFFQWNEFMELGKDVAEETLQARIANLAPNKCCTLIYTVSSSMTCFFWLETELWRFFSGQVIFNS